MRIFHRITLLLCLMVLASLSQAASRYDISAPGRVVAFGDVHGAYDDWTALLRELGVVDDQLNTSISDTYAIGECAHHNGRVYGLVY